jgi:TnpA family transposase
VYILDGLLHNRSEIRPDTLHADTQGQSETVFGLACLLAIQLMPRIRHWKDPTLYAPSERFATEQIEHIRELFGDTADWSAIKTHLPDILRVALSISQGKIRALPFCANSALKAVRTGYIWHSVPWAAW